METTLNNTNMKVPKVVHITFSQDIPVDELYDEEQLESLQELTYEEAKESVIEGVKKKIEDYFDPIYLKFSAE